MTGTTKLVSFAEERKDVVVGPRQEWPEVFAWRDAAAFAPPWPRLRLGRPFRKGGFANLVRGGEF
jgi:hypothetical protein